MAPAQQNNATEKVVIIIPTYNEADNIQHTLRELFSVIQPLKNYDAHVLIFDSASTDNTQSIIKTLQEDYPQLHLQSEDAKTGLGSAYHQAMRYAMDRMQADIIFEFDADLSHKPEYIPAMLEKLHQCNVVLASRYVPGGRIPSDWGWHRKLFSVLGNYVARALLTWRYKDFTSGFRATRCEALKKALPKKFLSQNYAYKLELLWRLHKTGAQIEEYPIHFVDRTIGQSKLPRNSIIDSLRVVGLLRLKALKRYIKMCMFGSIGIVVQLIAYNTFRHYLSPFYATQIATLAAIINNFLLNARFNFRTPASHLSLNERGKRLLLFLAYSIAMIYFQSYFIYFGTQLFGTGLLKENLILLSGIFAGSLANFYIYSQKIWPESRPAPYRNNHYPAKDDG